MYISTVKMARDVFYDRTSRWLDDNKENEIPQQPVENEFRGLPPVPPAIPLPEFYLYTYPLRSR